MSITLAARQALADHRFGGQTHAAVATLYFGAFRAMPNAAGVGGTEVPTLSFARKAVANNLTNFPAADGSAAKVLGADIVFDPNGGSDESIVGFGIWDAATSGNLLDFAQNTVSGTPTTITVHAGDMLILRAGEVTFTQAS